MTLKNKTKIFACMAVMGMVFAAPSFAGTVCSKNVATQVGNIDSNDPLMYAMESIILSKDFDPSLPYKVTSKTSRCSELGKAKQSPDRNSLNGIPGPDPSPSEGDVRTVTQSRDDGTRSWTYTMIDGQWVLTLYSFIPKTEEEAPEDP